MSGKLVKMKGLAQIPLMIGLLIMAIAIPAALKLVQQEQDRRSSAAGEVINGNVCSYSNVGAVDCVGNVVYFCSVGNNRLAYWQSSTDCTKTSQVCSRGSCVTPCSAAACTSCTTSSACSAISSCTWGYVGSTLSCSKKTTTVPTCSSQANSACVGNVATCTTVEGGVVVSGSCSSGVCCKVTPGVVASGTAITPNTAACGNLKGQCATFSNALSTGTACSVGGKVGTINASGLCPGDAKTVCCLTGVGTVPVVVPPTTTYPDTCRNQTNGSCWGSANTNCANVEKTRQDGIYTSLTGNCNTASQTGTFCCKKTNYVKPSITFTNLTNTGLVLTGSVSCSTCDHVTAVINGVNVNMTKTSAGVFTLSYTVPSVGTYTALVRGCSISTSGSIYNNTCPSGALTEATKSVTVSAVVVPSTTYTCAANGNYCTGSDNNDSTVILASGTCPSGQKCVNCAPAVICTAVNQGQRVATGVRINIDGSGCSKTCPAVTIFSTCNCPNGQAKKTGDANCDGLVTLTDFAIWSDEFTKRSTTTKSNFGCVSGRTSVELDDFAIWRDNFKGDL